MKVKATCCYDSPICMVYMTSLVVTPVIGLVNTSFDGLSSSVLQLALCVAGAVAHHRRFSADADLAISNSMVALVVAHARV